MRRAAVVVLAACSRATEPAPAPLHAVEPVPVIPPAPTVGPAPVDAAPPPPLPDVAEAGCLEGWRGLDSSTCWLGAPDATTLLVYLSGIVPPLPRSLQKETVARVVAAAATRAHVAAILPRGRRGIGPADVKDWWAWPTSVADADRLGPGLVREWTLEPTELETALGHRFGRTYLAGSSSGAYFLALLALRPTVGLDALDALEPAGFACASGGAAVARRRWNEAPVLRRIRDRRSDERRPEGARAPASRGGVAGEGGGSSRWSRRARGLLRRGVRVMGARKLGRGSAVRSVSLVSIGERRGVKCAPVRPPRLLLSLSLSLLLLLVAGAIACGTVPAPTEPKPAPPPPAKTAEPPPPAPEPPPPMQDLGDFLRARSSLRPFVEKAEQYKMEVYLSIPDLSEPKWTSREGFRVDAEYFYPASTIKLAIAVAALEKLTDLREKGAPVDARTTLVGDAKHGANKKKPSPTTTSIVGAMDRALILSDNDSADVLYDFVGSEELHQRMWGLGLDSIRVRHRLGIAGTASAKVAPAMQLLPSGADPVLIPARASTLDLGLNDKPLVGGAPATRFRPKIEPMSFAKKNRISVKDLQDLLVTIVRPDLHQPKSSMGNEERALLTRALETRASERLGNTSQDGIHKTLLPGIERVVKGEDLLIASKSGRAYGFVVENAWVVRMSDSKSFFLTVVLYTSSSGRMSEDSYQYETVGFPILADLGEAIATRVFGAK